MSRVGKQPIKLPKEVTLNKEGEFLNVKGPKGELKLKIHPLVEIDIKDEEVKVNPKQSEDPKKIAMWGTYRVLVNNMIVGVTNAFTKQLEINGTGYKAQVNGKKLVLEVGYSHPVEVIAPEGIDFSIEKNVISISGISKQQVGEWAARIRRVRKVEPYKGKGIKYVDEYVRRKVGKKAAGEGS